MYVHVNSIILLVSYHTTCIHVHVRMGSQMTKATLRGQVYV